MAVGRRDRQRFSPESSSFAFGVAATTIARLARTDEKVATALSLDLASRIVNVLDCGIEDLLEVVEA